MRNVLLALLFGFTCAVSSMVIAQEPANSSQQIQQLQRQADTYIRQQKPAMAVPLLRRIVALNPADLNAQANLGVLLFFQGNYQAAIAPMRTAVQMQSDLWRIRALLGIAEKRTGDTATALADLESAFSNLSEQKIKKQAGLELIELDAAASQFDKALAVIQELRTLAPQDPQILFVTYQLSVQMKDQSLLSMMILAPESAEMHMMLGDELGRQGDNNAAIAQFREAIRLNPQLPGVHFELAERLRASPDPALKSQAEGEFRAAIQANQFDEKAWRQLGEILADKGEFKAAQENYRKALALDPKDTDAKTDAAIALISLNQPSEAIRLLEDAIKDDPTNMTAHYRLATLYRQAGRTQDAQREMDTFLHYKDLKQKMGAAFRQSPVHDESK
jgi:tetratricopeptide (TPR) repeat protein